MHVDVCEPALGDEEGPSERRIDQSTNIETDLEIESTTQAGRGLVLVVAGCGN